MPFHRHWLAHTLALCLAAGPAGAQAPAQAPAAPASAPWLLHAARLYIAPDQPPLQDAAVLVRGATIVSIGRRGELQAPPGTPVSGCSGPVVTAGFYNSHVHLLGPVWADAAGQPPARLAQALQALLTRHGFTTGVDLGSDHANTAALQRRLDRGELAGPRLLTLGLPLFPPQGLPAYLDAFGPAFLARLPQPETPAAAVGVVLANLDQGAVGTKLFLVTPRAGRLQRMSADVARAAAIATQRRGAVVVAHPTDVDGVQAALDAGVDLLAHTTHGTLARWPGALVQQAVARGVSMTPTLQLMGYELAKEQARGPIVQQLIDASVSQVRDFAAAGGDILFGTDAGYMTDLNPAGEYELLARAGLGPMQILASLTTRPAAKWKDTQRGRLAAGMAADIVVLEADPADDPAHFSRVRCTIGAGRVLYERAR